MHRRIPQQQNYTQNPHPLTQLHPLSDQHTGKTVICLQHENANLTPLLFTQLGDTLNRQFESVCETMFGEVESQAVEALDLPGVFRTRSHSYVRAIQAGCSQDDDCLSVFSMSGPQGSIKSGAGECARQPGVRVCSGSDRVLRACACLSSGRSLVRGAAREPAGQGRS